MEEQLIFDKNSILEFEMPQNKEISVKGNKQSSRKFKLKCPITVPYAVLIGQWIVECRGTVVLMKDNGTTLQERVGVIIEESRMDVQIKCSQSGRRITKKYNQVTKIEVVSNDTGVIRIYTNISNTTTSEPWARNPTPQESPGTRSEQNDNRSATGNGRTDEPSNNVQDHTLEMRAELNRLRVSLENEKEKTRSLQQLVSSRLDDVIVNLNRHQNDLNAENKEKLSSINTLETELDELKDKVSQNGIRQQDLEKKKLELEIKLRKAEEMREALELDCDLAQKELEDIKERLSLDDNTIELLNDGHKLKYGTVTKTFDKMKEELSVVEDRIAFILKVRKKIDRSVEDAILRGDGTIRLDDETGGITNGDGETTAPENE